MWEGYRGRLGVWHLWHVREDGGFGEPPLHDLPPTFPMAHSPCRQRRLCLVQTLALASAAHCGEERSPAGLSLSQGLPAAHLQLLH